MDKFVTVTKSSRGRASDKDETRTNHRYNPYGFSKNKGRQLSQRRNYKQNETLIHAISLSEDSEDQGLPKASPSTITKHLLNTLSEEWNPITHSDSGRHADHVSSATTGHQRAERHGSARRYFESRRQKLENQSAPQESTVLSNARVYINGYLRDTTDIEMKRIVVQAGGRVLQTASGATHVLTSHQLNASKKHKILTSNAKVKVHIVRPEWVIDSVAAGKRLCERKYSILTDNTAKDLLAMFSK
ncbi:hypothetical protein EW146_g5090 [Bondarzewia mesenterica]|uniref:BRCT domain-containing protein n=1 Tax=Bondarzewia mesenterica TaxID=1095465 RepID=A0A4S4LSI3_9AGAM|nr:hypothetical protein EW146_g5090 [Bondarzewia mesenterica]